ncbi:hypothetical protein [Pseudomonas sp. NPDC089569]|uniref:hypothetical protein n=1 Tax=Pseudomonas sp. NPDC089569 TaxID=3390722 RepID=UPI003D010A7B
MAFDRGMIGAQLHLPRAIKKLIHQRANAISNWLNLADISHHTAPINEPYATQIWLEVSNQRQDQQILMVLISAGLNQQQAERYLQCYGINAPSHLAAIPQSALPFVNNGTAALKGQLGDAAESINTSFELLLWLQNQADRGHTLCDRIEIPKRLRATLDACVNNRSVRADETKVQLSSHALLQTRGREKLEELTANFFPTYGDPEIEFAYSRLEGLLGEATIDFYSLLPQLVNQRVVILTYSSMTELAELVEQYSALVQTLHWSPPQIVVYSEHRTLALAKWLPYEEILPFYQVSSHRAESGQSRIVIDFDQFSLSDLVVFLEQVEKEDQLILVSHHAAEPCALTREFHLRDLYAYFHNVALNRSLQPPTFPKAASHAELDEAIDQGHTIISDDLDLVQQINSRHKAAGTLKLVTPEGGYSKHQPVLFRPRGARRFDSFIGVVISTSDKGLMVNAAGVVRQLTNEFVSECQTSKAYAIDVFDAVRIGIKRGVLLTCHDHGLAEYLRDSGTEIVRHYALPAPSHNAKIPSGQRITPLVEGLN